MSFPIVRYPVRTIKHELPESVLDVTNRFELLCEVNWATLFPQLVENLHELSVSFVHTIFLILWSINEHIGFVIAVKAPMVLIERT